MPPLGKFHKSSDGVIRPCKAKTEKSCRAGGGLPHFDSIEEGEKYLADQKTSPKVIRKESKGKQLGLNRTVSEEVLNKVLDNPNKYSVIAPDGSSASFKRPLSVNSEECAATFWSMMETTGMNLGEESDPNSIISLTKTLTSPDGFSKIYMEAPDTPLLETAYSFTGTPTGKNRIYLVNKGEHIIRITEYESPKLSMSGLTPHKKHYEVAIQARRRRGPKVIIEYFEGRENISIELLSEKEAAKRK